MKSIRLLPCFGAAKEGDKGYMVIPKDVGLLCNFKNKKPGEYDIPIYGFNNCNMPLLGMVRDESGFAGIITSGQFDAQLHITTNSGVRGTYSVDPIFKLRSFVKEKRLSDDLNIQYHFLVKEEANWLGVAKRYRKYNTEYRKIQPLRDRVKSSPELAYSAQALEVRMRMGVKPVPTPVLEQTPENEPLMRTFLTFKKLRDIFDEFHNQGIDKTEFCVVGWHSGGHDGRFPQLFPVEQVFGGEEELRKSIAHGQSLGYQIVSHDCYDDSYRISKDWDEKNVRKNPDGQLHKGSRYAGGQSYNLCRIQAYEVFAKRDEPMVKELGFKGVHYNDVLSILGPTACYDPKHPATRRQDAEASNKILALSKEIFGGVQSEGPLDFTATVLDRVLYITIHFKESPVTGLPYMDELVPLYPAVYHGTLLYNIWNDCVNTEPGNEFYLKNIEYGGMPVAYFYGHFWLDPGKNWLGDRDLHYDDSNTYWSERQTKKCIAGPGVRIFKVAIDVAGALAGLSRCPSIFPSRRLFVSSPKGPIFIVQRRAGRLIEDGADGYAGSSSTCTSSARCAPTPEKGTGAVVSTKAIPASPRGPLSPGDAARRAPPVLERAPRGHVARGAAPGAPGAAREPGDGDSVLRGTHARREARSDGARPDLPRLHRRPGWKQRGREAPREPNESLRHRRGRGRASRTTCASS